MMKIACQIVVLFVVLSGVSWAQQDSIELTHRKICWDSFLPSPVYFEEGSAKLSDSIERQITLFLRSLKAENAFTDTLKIELKGAVAYDERNRLARERLTYIYQLLIEAGFKPEHLDLNCIGKRPLFICRYCDGCHYSFLKGKGDWLSRKTFRKLQTDLERKQHLAERRVVMLAWKGD